MCPQSTEKCIKSLDPGVTDGCETSVLESELVSAARAACKLGSGGLHLQSQHSEAEAVGFLSLVYRMSSRKAWAIQRNPSLRKK